MPPVVIAAGVTAAAAIGGGLLSASAQKKAAKTAAASADKTATVNNALSREIYGQNKDIARDQAVDESNIPRPLDHAR